jgi:Kef-type K+ transport system membrane component KefB
LPNFRLIEAVHASDPFLLELLLIFVSAKVFGEVFERLALPAVLGEILAGVLLGPYAFRMVAATVIADGHPINSLAGLGAIFLLFSVGLETPAGELLKVAQSWPTLGERSCTRGSGPLRLWSCLLLVAG